MERVSFFEHCKCASTSKLCNSLHILPMCPNKLLSIVDDKTPLPAAGASEEEDFQLLADEPYIDSPIKVDYGFNLR